MPIINFMNPITLLVGVILFVLVSYLGKKTKKSWIVAIMLFVFITLLICYAVQFLTLNQSKYARTCCKPNGFIANKWNYISIYINFFLHLFMDR